MPQMEWMVWVDLLLVDNMFPILKLLNANWKRKLILFELAKLGVYILGNDLKGRIQITSIWVDFSSLSENVVLNVQTIPKKEK